jgi:hypothetical protein
MSSALSRRRGVDREPQRSPHGDLIPIAIVRLNRVMIVSGVVIACALNAPPIATALFVIVALAALFGRRASPIYQIGSRVWRVPADRASGEDPLLMRFNKSLAATFLGLAQIAFALHWPLSGWILCGFTALAAALALAGFCFGCCVFYQFKLNRFRVLRSLNG